MGKAEKDESDDFRSIGDRLRFPAHGGVNRGNWLGPKDQMPIRSA